MADVQFRLGCSFSHLGTEDTIKRPNHIVDVTEFLGEEEEHHSGSFETTLEVSDDNELTLLQVLKIYLIDNNLLGECFTVSKDGVILFTEHDVNLKYV